MTVKSKPPGEVQLRDVAKQRRRIERLREQEREATDRLSEMLVEVRDSDDPDVTLTAAARAMGISKQTVNSLLARAGR